MEAERRRERQTRTDCVGHSERHVAVNHDGKVRPDGSSPLLVCFNVFLQTNVAVCWAVGQLSRFHKSVVRWHWHSGRQRDRETDAEADADPTD